MKRYLAPVFCGAFLFAGWIVTDASAQNAAAEADAHMAKAKAAAYRPGNDISDRVRKDEIRRDVVILLHRVCIVVLL